ncbi:hypothetical protein [Streptomyces nigrescens]|uniref:hypothetical protein n=1 Tax=Streptomyces nigrescens TaxID=1920 RepID=UPI0036F87879
MADLPYWPDDPKLVEARAVHRLLSEPYDGDSHYQRYVGSCSSGDWEAGRPLDFAALQEEFDLHMGAVQNIVHST